MEDVLDASTHLHSILNLYVDEFKQNQESVKAHLKGRCFNNEPPLLPAFLPPSSYWTSAEKDLFFHALSVHSRLRPELLAQHVKTKSTFDVCVYLEVLQRAAESMEEDEEETREGDSLRAEMEPAMELSEKWVLREEAIADSLVSLDACSCSLEGSNSKLVDKCTCPSSIEGDSQDVVDHPMPQIYPNNHLNHLDPICLAVLETIRREEETEDQPDDTQSLPEERQRSTSLLDPRASLPPGENHLPSGPADDADQNIPISRNPSPNPDKAQLRRIQKRLYMRRKRAEVLGTTVNMEAVKLRPGRQTRDPKPPPKTDKCRETRSSGRGKKRLSRGGASQSDCSDSEDEAGDQESTYERSTRRGVTRPYKLKKLFHESGITARTLSEMDLDLFNLTALGRLLRLTSSLHAPSRKRDDSSISVECLQLLREMIKEFSTKVIQRAIIMKEQEIRLKANLKVWKYDREEITIENMMQCLKALGLGQLSKERHFSDILVDTDDDDESSEEMSVDGDSTVPDEKSPIESAPKSMQPSGSKSALLDHILPYDVDEAELTKELAEEDILDVLDVLRSKEYEKDLWKTHR